MNLKPKTLEAIKTFTNNYGPFIFVYAQKVLTNIYNDYNNLSLTQKERIEKKIKES